jgi:hypothetical protein
MQAGKRLDVVNVGGRSHAAIGNAEAAQGLSGQDALA